MLKQRVVTALILSAVFLGALFYLPVPLFSIFIAVALLVSAWEWANLSGFSQAWQRVGYMALLAVATFLTGLYLGVTDWSVAAHVNSENLRQVLGIGGSARGVGKSLRLQSGVAACRLYGFAGSGHLPHRAVPGGDGLVCRGECQLRKIPAGSGYRLYLVGSGSVAGAGVPFKRHPVAASTNTR